MSDTSRANDSELALALMKEALRLLDATDNTLAATHLEHVIQLVQQQVESD